MTALFPDAAAIVSALGSFLDPDNTFSRTECARLDVEEEFPAAICRDLDRLGLPAQYVPVAQGGRLHDHAALVHVVRRISRRDLTVAVAHAKTFLGAACVWVTGSAGQRARLAGDVLAGVPVAWGLTEPDHGSDLVATGFAAERAPGGYRLTGVKWPINNATRGGLMCVLARTGETAERGPRALSLFLLDKRTLPPGTIECLPKTPTHGIRGADISGLRLSGAPAGPDALVGEPGTGLDTVLRALQLTRVMCTGLSLGAADQALQLIHEYVRERFLYQRLLIEMPHVRRTLGECCARLLLAEAVSMFASRSAHTLTGELAVTSALVKAFVPAVVDELISVGAEVLGARAFLTTVYADGAFAKLERDHRIVAIFDGNMAVNRNAVVNHLPALARYGDGAEFAAAVRHAATLDRPLPPIGELSLRSRTGTSVLRTLPSAVAELRGPARELGDALVTVAERLRTEAGRVRPSVRDVPAEAFELVERYEWAFAAAAAVHVAVANRDRRSTEPWWCDDRWLRGVLTLALDRLRAPLPAGAEQVFDELAGTLTIAERPSILPAADMEGE
ncbi:acyl-CoA dehydrogenase family protein [Actinoplanes sp. TBRC 11911]|uniref:acyl-CoA dehydrogenase family protein n=1 Tax=Actinoplanes sp. TBRC 11911 TaxID=2729386 RepID=UPI00145E8FD4|nr:acyl-CoA dehydrogenase family protein [Actinoplanes sp. TBRC 11911]NMO53353.1 acyl-CoA dehydrogenase family protein [Actinoplanes sp. TBRC 11911]